MVEAAGAPPVLILADDLIWATRLVDAVRAAGGAPIRIRRLEDLAAPASQLARHLIVDLTARAYDGLEAVRLGLEAGARVIAVGQHDDLALHRAAREAGAERVYAYRALFEKGPALLAAWLDGAGS